MIQINHAPAIVNLCNQYEIVLLFRIDCIISIRYIAHRFYTRYRRMFNIQKLTVQTLVQ